MFIVVLIILLAVGFWWALTLHTDASIERLKETGFVVDYTLPSTPPVVFDKAHKKIAFIKLNKVLVYDYDQVLDWQWRTKEQPGWGDKSEKPENPYLIFYLQDVNQPTLQVEGFDEVKVKQWQAQLNTLLPNKASGKR